MSSNGATGGRREDATSTTRAALCLAMLSELKLITVRSVPFILPDEINNALLERVGKQLEGNNAKGHKQRDKSQN